MLCHLRHDGPVVLFYNSLESVQGVSYGGICPHESVETSVNGFCSLLAVKPSLGVSDCRALIGKKANDSLGALQSNCAAFEVVAMELNT